MKQFSILTPDGHCITEQTVIRKRGSVVRVTTPFELCNLIKSCWCKWTGSKSFTDWANAINSDPNFSGGETKEGALDHLASNFTLNVDGKHVDLYYFFLEHKPFKN